MHFKTISLLFALFISSSTLAANEKLNNYEAIKNKLMSGANVKAIVDLKNDCPKIDVEGKVYSPNIFSFTFEKFIISYRTKAIITADNYLNANSDGNPFGQAAYSIGEISILPNNAVVVEAYAMGVPDYKTMQSMKATCTMSTGSSDAGVKFFAA